MRRCNVLTDKTDLLVLVVRNSGKGLAKNVRFEAEPLPDHLPSKLVADAVMRLEMFSGGVDMLASGELYGGVFASMLALAAELPDQTFGGVLKLKATYEKCFWRSMHFRKHFGFEHTEFQLVGN